MNTLPEISECVPFPTFDDVEWKGKVVEFSPDIYSEIPQSVNASELSAVNRNRYTSFGLIDNVVVYVTKGSSFQLGQWMIGCLLQKRYPFYTVEFGEKSEGLSRLRLETEEEWNVETSLNKFTWNPKSSEGLIFDKDFSRTGEWEPGLQTSKMNGLPTSNFSHEIH